MWSASWLQCVEHLATYQFLWKSRSWEGSYHCRYTSRYLLNIALQRGWLEGFWEDMSFGSYENILPLHILISSHVPDLLDLTGYCVSRSLLVGGFAYCFNKRTWVLFLSVSLCETFFSISFGDGKSLQNQTSRNNYGVWHAFLKYFTCLKHVEEGERAWFACLYWWERLNHMEILVCVKQWVSVRAEKEIYFPV